MEKRVARCNQLIKKIQKGNTKALDELYNEFGALFLNVAKKYLFDKSYAEDILSEVFLEIFQSAARSFDSEKNGLNWIFTIIKRKAYRHNGNNYLSLDLVGLDKARNLIDFTAAPDDADKILLKKALSELSDFENELLYYHYWEGLTVREIAAKVGKPRSTVHYTINRALKNIEKFYKE